MLVRKGTRRTARVDGYGWVGGDWSVLSGELSAGRSAAKPSRRVAYATVKEKRASKEGCSTGARAGKESGRTKSKLRERSRASWREF